MLRLSTMLSFVRGLSNSGELGSICLRFILYKYVSFSYQHLISIDWNISIMIMVNVKKHKQESCNPPMAYRAATYGFRNQRLSEMISLVLPSIENSHALKPSGSPIKVTNIEITIKFLSLSWCYCSSNWVGMRIIVYKCVWNKVEIL